MNANTKTLLVAFLAALAEEEGLAVPEVTETKTVRKVTPLAPEVTPTKVLSRGAWKALRTTRKGVVKPAFAGLTREQAFEAGLCKGYHLPTGDMRAAIQLAKEA